MLPLQLVLTIAFGKSMFSYSYKTHKLTFRGRKIKFTFLSRQNFKCLHKQTKNENSIVNENICKVTLNTLFPLLTNGF